MAQATQALTPIDSSVEIETFAFDFGPALAASSETISSVISVSCTTSISSSITDSAASSRIIGVSSVASSPTTEAANSAVLQQFGTMLANVTYTLQCVVLTSGGQQLSVWRDLPCISPV